MYGQRIPGTIAEPTMEQGIIKMPSYLATAGIRSDRGAPAPLFDGAMYNANHSVKQGGLVFYVKYDVGQAGHGSVPRRGVPTRSNLNGMGTQAQSRFDDLKTAEGHHWRLLRAKAQLKKEIKFAGVSKQMIPFTDNETPQGFTMTVFGLDTILWNCEDRGFPGDRFSWKIPNPSMMVNADGTPRPYTLELEVVNRKYFANAAMYLRGLLVNEAKRIRYYRRDKLTGFTTMAYDMPYEALMLIQDGIRAASLPMVAFMARQAALALVHATPASALIGVSANGQTLTAAGVGKVPFNSVLDPTAPELTALLAPFTNGAPVAAAQLAIETYAASVMDKVIRRFGLHTNSPNDTELAIQSVFNLAAADPERLCVDDHGLHVMREQKVALPLGYLSADTFKNQAKCQVFPAGANRSVLSNYAKQQENAFPTMIAGIMQYFQEKQDDQVGTNMEHVESQSQSHVIVGLK